ncbi:MAG TPA: hypothetical protein PKM36_06105 [Propionibacteriaceae bacterium]|nr:hypothetical protein [Propionibacteriaceae bacterium]HPZ48885.1 hypothetical protein [Propionibacteriaceae bacterium]HQE31449.1 hypothetical protein [Propionibacteriaceae bacterium]
MSDDLLDWYLLTPEQRADKEIRADVATRTGADPAPTARASGSRSGLRT